MMEHSVIFPDHRKVCALGQGTWKMGKSALREADEIDALRAGIELGMSVVDTAEMYGNEEMVGAAIRGLRDRVFLVTKVLPGNASRTGTKAACERSLNRLKTDYVDLFLLHWGGPHPIEDTVASMIELQQEGKIKHGASAIWTFRKWSGFTPSREEFPAPPTRFFIIWPIEVWSTICCRGAGNATFP